jgi:hypothetical protein
MTHDTHGETGFDRNFEKQITCVSALTGPSDANDSEPGFSGKLILGLATFILLVALLIASTAELCGSSSASSSSSFALPCHESG